MNEEVRQYVLERLVAAYPNIDVSVGSRAYRQVADPIARRLSTDLLNTDVVRFITERVKEAFPDIDTSEGSDFKDLFIYPLSAIVAPLQAEVRRLEVASSIYDPQIMSTEEMDQKVANLLMDRREGVLPRGSVRVYFRSPRPLYLDPSIVFFSNNGLRLVPEDVTQLTSDEMEEDNTGFYYDIPVRATMATDVSAPPGSVTQQDGLTGVLKVTNPLPIAPGTKTETNEELLARAIATVSDRSPTTARGIRSYVFSTMEDVTRVEVVGFGDPEMTRDVIQLSSTPKPPGPGDLIAATSQFMTVDCVTLPTGLRLPFTNRIKLTNPPASLKALVRESAYIRVVDGMGHYDTRALTQYRPIKSIEEIGTDLFVTTSDFAVISGDAAPGEIPTAVPGATTGALAYNIYASQGAAWASAVVNEDNRVFVRGAPLPVTDAMWAPGALPNDGPLPGKDYLVVASLDPTITFEPGDLPGSVQMWPIKEILHASAVLRVGRRSGDLPAADLSVGRKASEYGIRIGALGGPKLTADLDERYSDDSLEEWSVYPGATIQLYDNNSWSVWSANQLNTCRAEVTLPPTVSETLPLNVKAGDFISLALPYDEEVVTGDSEDPHFNGSWIQLETTNGVRWMAWGRIVAVEPGRVLRVEGLDVRGLHTLPSADKCGFSWASGTFSDPISGPAVGLNRLFWAIYESFVNVRTPQGDLQAFTDFDFLPARSVGTATPWHMNYVHDALEADTTGAAPIVHSPATHAVFSIRIGTARIPDRASYSFVRMPSADLDQAIAVQRYPSASRVIGGAGGVPVITHPVRTPYVQGEMRISKDFVVTPAPLPNPLAAPGQFLPHPCGPLSLEDEALEAAFVGAASIDAQILEFYKEADEQTEWAADNALSVVEVPGAYPQVARALEVGEGTLDTPVHVGGAFDVYISSPLEEETVQYTLLPDGQEGTVVAQGTDGLVYADNSGRILSQALYRALVLGAGVSEQPESAIDVVASPEDYLGRRLALHIPNGLAGEGPETYQIVGMIRGGALLSPTIPNDEDLHGVHWQLCVAFSSVLNEPMECIWVGKPAHFIAGSQDLLLTDSLTIPLPGGSIVVAQTPTGVEVRTVSTFTSSTIRLTTPFIKSGHWMHFRVLAPQSGTTPLQNTLINVESVEAIVGDSQLVVPYRHPVRCVVTSLVTGNDEILSDLGTGEFPVLLEEGGVAILEVEGAAAGHELWKLAGVKPDYAVTVQPLIGTGKSESYSVVGVDGSKLVLDKRPGALEGKAVKFSIGPAVIGTATVYFENPTYFKVGPDTDIMPVSAPASRFRPSPYERADIVRPGMWGKTPGSCVSKLDHLNRPRVLEVSADILLSGLRAGDTMVVSNVIMRSGTISASTIAVSGARLEFVVAGRRVSVLFPSSQPKTPGAVAADITAQTGGRIVATYSGGILWFACESAARIDVAGSPNLAFSLGLTDPNAIVDNRPGGAEFFGTKSITAIETTGTGTVLIHLDSNLYGVDLTHTVYAYRMGWQEVYPNQMRPKDGLWAADIRVLLDGPLPQGLDLRNAECDVENYTSTGWEFTIDGRALPYTANERVGISITPVVHEYTGEPNTFDQGVVVGSGRAVISCKTSPQVRFLQTALLRDNDRAVCSNGLARHLVPAEAAVDISYVQAMSSDEVRAVILRAMDTLGTEVLLSETALLEVLAEGGVGGARLESRVRLVTPGLDRRIRTVLATEANPRTTTVIPSVRFISATRRVGN